MKIQKIYGIYLFSFALIWAFWLQITAKPSEPKPNPKEEIWFLSPPETLSLPDFKVIDTRSYLSRFKNKIPNGIVLGWEDLSLTDAPFRGKLLNEDKIQKKLSVLGISPNDWLVVLGDGKSGWGEEGRLVWSLREVGYHHSFWYDGSDISLLSILKQRKQLKTNSNQSSVSFLQKEKILSQKTNITKEEIKKDLGLGTYQILDTREVREFNGSTPYGEVRGGHIPGAKSLYYQNLFDDTGKIKSKEQVEKTLSQLGISPTKPIIAYCTGGVRSAFVVGILRSYGYNAYNYSGSMWEWSSFPDLPLEK